MTAAVPALREVRLYGALGREFGRVFRLAVATPAEAVQALCAVLPGFERRFLGADGRQAYHVFVGRGAHRRDIGQADANAVVGSREPIRLVPVIAGAKRQGALQTIVGAVLVLAGVLVSFYTYGADGGIGAGLVDLGVAMMLGGVIQLLSPQRTGKDERNESTPSYAFDGPINNTEQGGPVPLAYGRVIVGSVVASQGFSTTEVVFPPPAELEIPELPSWEGGGPGDGGGDGGGGGE